MTNPIEHVLILGGTSGIGLAAARRLSGEGLKVTIAGRDKDRLAAAAAGLSGKVDARPLDAADAAQVRDFFKAVGAFDQDRKSVV